ncbi:MAG: co-chaperone GroES [Dactylosporangium sp.]|nr:co-chaperone GroES [Dactylosporangium sp.]NNJ60069.1 co-chaperone GroES [Dactylosporangium sp.]
MAETIQPLGSRVLVRVLEEDSVTPSGLFLPDTAKEKPQRGEVVAIGDDEETITVRVGDRVFFAKYTGTEIAIRGEEYLVLDAGDLLAVLRDAPVPAGMA